MDSREDSSSGVAGMQAASCFSKVESVLNGIVEVLIFSGDPK